MNDIKDTRRAPGEQTSAPLGTSAHGRRLTAILDRHRSKLAIVYVRQSSTQQVFDHQESRQRQYALGDYAATLGWPRDRIEVIDDDQGRSGRTAANRPGVQRLLINSHDLGPARVGEAPVATDEDKAALLKHPDRGDVVPSGPGIEGPRR